MDDSLVDVKIVVGRKSVDMVVKRPFALSVVARKCVSTVGAGLSVGTVEGRTSANMKEYVNFARDVAGCQYVRMADSETNAKTVEGLRFVFIIAFDTPANIAHFKLCQDLFYVNVRSCISSCFCLWFLFFWVEKHVLFFAFVLIFFSNC